MGFTLNEILELLALSTGSDAACGNVKETATRSIRRIEEQVRALTRMQRALEKLVVECRNGGPTGDCPIIQALEEAEE